MTTKHTPATPLPALGRVAGENDPLVILGAVVPKGAPMRALLKLQDERRRLIELVHGLAMGEIYDEASFEATVTREAVDEARALLHELGEL